MNSVCFVAATYVGFWHLRFTMSEAPYEDGHQQYRGSEPGGDDDTDPRYMFFAVFGVILPILVILGCIGNLSAFVVLQHSKLRNPHTVYLSALFLIETAYLVCAMVTESPFTWYMYNKHDFDSAYNDYLETLQAIWIHANTALLICNCLVIWLSLAMVAEQYMLMFHPLRALDRHQGGESSMKMVISVIGLSLVLHLIYFFKYRLHQGRYNPSETLQKICLSEMYLQNSMQSFDKFIYPVLSMVLPWLITLILLCIIIKSLIEEASIRYAVQRNIPTVAIPVDPDQLRVFKSSRSLRTLVVLGIFFLVLCGTNIAMFLVTLPTLYTSDLANAYECHTAVVDVRFNKQAYWVEILYIYSISIYSAISFPVFFICSTAFRGVCRETVRDTIILIRHTYIHVTKCMRGEMTESVLLRQLMDRVKKQPDLGRLTAHTGDINRAYVLDDSMSRPPSTDITTYSTGKDTASHTGLPPAIKIAYYEDSQRPVRTTLI